MKRTKILILFVFFILVHTNRFAVKYPIVNYSNSDGLPQNQVNTLLQDKLGYIWIGTQSGLGKFDGNQFEALTKKSGLPDNYITDLKLDHEGNIWVATQEGLARISPSSNYEIKSFLTTEFIYSLYFDVSKRALWIFTNNTIYTLINGQFLKFTGLTPKIQNDEDHIIRGMLIDTLGTKYFYSQSEVIRVKKGLIQAIPGPASINCLKWVDKKIIAGTADGLFQLEIKDHSLNPYIDIPIDNRSINDIIEDEKGRLWICTERGFLLYDTPSSPPVIITEENGLPSRNALTSMIDREKNIFIGTRWGLAQLSPNLLKMYEESDGLPDRFVWSFEEDTDNRSVLVGCTNGIAELNLQTGKITPFTSINARLRNNSIRTIIKLKQNEFLLGTRNQGIYLWDRKENLVNIYPRIHILSGFKNANIIWFGTDDGLLKYDGKNFKWIKKGIKDKYVWAIDKLDDNSILIGTRKGVQKIYNDTVIPSPIENSLKKDTFVNDIRVVSPEEILIATELDGLLIFKNQRLKTITTADGLLHNDVWSVIKDDIGNIWLSTSISLERYSNGFISHFNKKTGLFGDEGSVHAGFKSSEGKIYFGINPGFIEIPVPKSDITIKNPILYVKKMKVNERLTPSTRINTIYLDYNQNNIEFDYVAISTRKENPIFYRTRLLPLYSQWSEPTRETHIKYLNLLPENYTFEVIANNGGGEKQWFSSQNKIFFTIEKPFWLKWWFILIGSILIIGLIILIVRVRLHSLEKQKKMLELVVKERTEELGIKNKELQYLSVTDPLTDLKNRRYLEEKIKEDVSLIERYIFDKRKSPEKEPVGLPPLLGVYILDIDHFKKVNDHYGHKAGDIVIIDIARLLIEMLRNSDTIVRWGGEEFLIITRQYGTKENSFELAERIRKKVQGFLFKIDENVTIHKTISVGFAHFPFIPNDIENVNWSHVVSLADSALYIAKNNGRNLSVGIENGEKPLDIDFKEIVSNIKMGIENKYLDVVSLKKNLHISQHKT